MTPIPFPTSKRVEMDVNGALFKEVMALTERCAVFLDGEGRAIERKLSGHAKVSYSVVSMRLTTAILDAVAVMHLARDWLGGCVSGETVETRMSACRLPSKRWWSEDAPPELVALCETARALSERVQGAQERLRRAVAEARDAA